VTQAEAAGFNAGVAPSDALLLERDREFQRIRSRLEQAARVRGSTLVIEGPAGIGKTALLAAGREAAERDGFRVMRARGAELEQEFAFGVVRQLVEPPLAQASETERAVLLEGPAGVVARLLALPGAPRAIDEPVAPDPSFAALHGLYWLFANLAGRGPVALTVDDAHWADRASLRFLAFLLPRLEELRIAVLLAARPSDLAAGGGLLSALTVDPATEVVTLGPLSSGGVAQLLGAALASEPEPAFVTACWEATGGTPFLVRTLVTALAAKRIAPVAASSGRVPWMATATVGRWALVQLERLGPDAARLARAVAVLERAELPEGAALAGLEPADAARAAGLLVRAGLLEERPLAFAHPILRAGVYGAMSVADRAEAHRRAADLLAERRATAARIAKHLLACAPAGDAWVAEQLRAAAEAASASGAPESAAAYLRRALAEPPPPESRAGVLLDLGLTELNAEQPGWEEHLTAALEQARDDATRAAAAQLLTMALAYRYRTGEAVEICDRVIARLHTGDAEARWTLENMAVVYGMNDAATAPSVADRARSLVVRAREQPVPRQAIAVAAFQAALVNEPAGSAAELARGALAPGPEPPPAPGRGPWFQIAVGALLVSESYAEAQALLDVAIRGARAAADRIGLAPALYQRAWLALRRGDLIAAESDARTLAEEDQLTAAPFFRVLAVSALVLTLVERGDLQAAERALEPLAADVEGTQRQAAVLRHARGRLRSAQRRFAEAAGDLLAAGDIATRTGVRNPSYLAWRSDAALAHLGLGDLEAAQRLSGEELELARAFGAPRALGVALRAAGLAAGGLRGEALLREAIEVLEGSDTRLEHARALADLGALLRRSNRRGEARALLRRALDAAHRAGARLLAAQAETELRATGARPRRILLTGLEALTASERRIAELAAEGLTNRQIAQYLFVTAGTVEGHLTNVFGKLDIGTRAQLSQALMAATAPALNDSS
jgi:DNA-binding CsgD family transcriptional regulator